MAVQKDDLQRSDQLLELDRRHVFRAAWAHGLAEPIFFERGEGPFLWDVEGRKYSDFLSQWVFANIGHQHPKMLAALKAQIDTLCNVAPSYGAAIRAEAAAAIASHAPEGMSKVFFTNGGAEANEHAIRMARLYTDKHKLLAAYRSYHGATSNAIAASGDPRRWRGDLATNGVVHFFGPYAFRSAFDARDEEEECERALSHLRQTIQFEGPATISAVLLETVGGSAGVLVPPPGYLQGVRELCDEYGLLFILDEVVTAFGRLGRWFGFEHWDVVPDLIIVGKGVSSGYAPLGGIIMSDAIAASFDEHTYPAGPTFSGHLLSCAAGAANVRIIEEEGILAHATELGESVLPPLLRKLADAHPVVGEVRGIGAYWTLDLVRDRDTREPLVPYGGSGGTSIPMLKLNRACRERGLLVGTNTGRVSIAPPCNTPEGVVEEGIAILDEALAVIDPYYGRKG